MNSRTGSAPSARSIASELIARLKAVLVEFLYFVLRRLLRSVPKLVGCGWLVSACWDTAL